MQKFSRKLLKISKRDLELMEELQKDGSLSYSHLAAKLNINPKTVARRVEGLIRSKVIAIRAQPNPFKMGLSASAVITVKADPSKIENICEQLSKIFYVNMLQTIFGRFDILVIVYFPNLEILHQFINNDLYTIDGVIQAEIYFIKDIFKRYERFFEKEPFAKSRVKLSKTDWALIEELARDGRTNPSELADRLGIHVTTVYRRIAVLLKRNIIKISAVPNPSRLTSANAYIILDSDPAEVDNICSCLYSCDEVHFLMTLNNRPGVIACVHTKDMEELYQFIKKKIAHMEGLVNIETFIRSMVQKTYYGWLLETVE